jgi:hypothetical protein
VPRRPAHTPCDALRRVAVVVPYPQELNDIPMIVVAS